MNILILNGGYSLEINRWREWFGNDATLIMISSNAAVAGFNESKKADEFSKYAEIIFVEDYFNSALVEYHALNLHKRYGFDKVVTASEGDRIRAARLRNEFGLDGQTTESALAFRDKLIMKKHLDAAKVSIAKFSEVNNVTDLFRFKEEVGFPFIIKPRLLSGSVGVAILRNDNDLFSYARECMPLNDDADAFLIAEEFIEHEKVYRVNGIIENGIVTVAWPSQWTHMLGFREGKITGSFMLDEDHWQFKSLIKLTVDGLQSLLPPKNAVFLSEIFERTDGTLFFNEAASSIGSFRSRRVMTDAFGFDFCQRVAQRECGMTINDVISSSPKTFAGFAAVPPRDGTLLSIPAECPFSSVTSYQVHAKIGQELHSPKRTTDIVASYVAIAQSSKLLEDQLDAVTSWFQSSIKYS